MHDGITKTVPRARRRAWTAGILKGAAIVACLAMFPAQALAEKKLLMLGDSITLSWVPEGEKIPDRVTAKLNQLSKTKWTVVNAGVNGDTAERGLKRVKALLDAEKPDVVTVAFGVNDAAEKKPEWFKDNLEKLVAEIAQHPSKPKIILITTTPLAIESKEIFYQQRGGMDAYIDAEINKVTRELAKDKKLLLIDLHPYLQASGKWPSFVTKDQVHPNKDGCEMAGNYIGEKLYELLEGKPSKGTQKAK